MWTPDPDRLVKVTLRSDEDDPETPWAEDLGEDPRRPGSRLVRIGNVPFLHAKPTYGDVVSVEPDEDGLLTWDRGDTAFEDIDALIVEDAGRWAMIVDYALSPEAGVDLKVGFGALVRAGEHADIVVEGCFANEAAGTGRAYLAVPGHLEVEAAFELLVKAELPLTLDLVHPVDDEDE